MVIPIVNVPHALSASAFTTAKPSPASAIVTTNKMASAAVTPENPLISLRAISAKDFPPRLTEAKRITRS